MTDSSVPTEAPRRRRVAAIIVTWNRGDDARRALEAVARQDFGPDRIDVVVVDNASTDGTADTIEASWAPDGLVDNSADHQQPPRFQPRAPTRGRASGSHPFGSLSLVRNQRNVGGCGGFNTGLGFVAEFLDAPDAPDPPSWVWLIDDDAMPANDALTHLVRTLEADPSIGLAGSRMVHPDDPALTLETTVFFDPRTARYEPDAGPDHPQHGAHRAWLGEVGAATGRAGYAGVREVDIAAACSLLARWSAVREVGFWDPRFFIAGDDTEWALRFKQAGWRVVCCLDAVVRHEPWSAKQSPIREYYRKRNVFWIWEKNLPRRRRRRLAGARILNLVRTSARMARRRRSWRAELVRLTVDHAVRNIGGPLRMSEPPAMPIGRALERVGALEDGSRVLAICPSPRARQRIDRARAHIEGISAERGHREKKGPTASWRLAGPGTRVSLRSRTALLLTPPRCVLLPGPQALPPLVPGRWTMRLEGGDPTLARVEPGGLVWAAGFAFRWAPTLLRCVGYLVRLPCRRPVPASPGCSTTRAAGFAGSG